MNILTVPIRVDAFIAQAPEPVVLTGDDFSNLPFVNKQKIDINYESPNLASTIDKKPLSGFEYLPPGVHLHWSMPDAMTKGEINDTGISMPTLPNRWLVRRVHKSNASQVKSWIVESDYLYPQGVVPERAITIPAISNGNVSAQPLEYLGRQLPLDQWLHEPLQAKQSHRYLPDLNVMGWGTAYFATLYTDCCSVFGFHDEEFSNQEVHDYTYEVYGWYNKPEQDYVQVKLNQEGIPQAQQAKDVASWIMEQSQNMEACVCYG